MWTIKTFSVAPLIPNRLKRLGELAYNLWWCWHPDGIALFRRLDADLWETVKHNPVALLGEIEQDKLKQASEDEGLVAHQDRVLETFDAYMTEPRWYQKGPGREEASDRVRIAYFSAEFGLTDCLPIYSGGLGVLAGDHLKSASDLGLPLVAVGMLYSQGYFLQYLNADGWQQEAYPNYDYSTMPVRMCERPDGTPLTFELDCPDHKITVQVWYVEVGRVKLYLLDTNLPCNSPTDREITARLYGGDLEMRIKQEILLGIGGLRALAELGIDPEVCHMNEGHSAFLALERIHRLMETRGLSFEEAREATVPGNIFTTHTPVPAGNDIFPAALINKYFLPYYSHLGLAQEQFLALGRQNPKDDNEPFSMTVLALHLASHCNAVSELHGRVSRQMWQRVWPGLPVGEVPIRHITNGVHNASWTSKDMAELLERYLGPRWRDDTSSPAIWEKVSQIPDSELWRTHERRRERLVGFARRSLRQQLIKRGASRKEVIQAEEVLDPEALTIGFARRFATYKRAAILMMDTERLAKLLNDPKHPVQIMIAGKAHPRDSEGKELIRRIIHLARSEQFRRKLVFLEGYDLNVARYLVQGVDVWLNTPRRPMEASGTSGMKVACNGGLNFSILDGWWNEGFRIDNGWAIGSGEVYEDWEYQDKVEGQALYNTLENEIVPTFYERGPDGLPRKWIQRMKQSMTSLCPFFTTHRMVRDYAETFYLPAATQFERMIENDLARAIALAKWKQSVAKAWPEIRIENVEQSSPDKLTVGHALQIRANIRLGSLSPDDVDVQVYTGQLNGQKELRNTHAVPMTCTQSSAQSHLYEVSLPCSKSGMHGYGVRILPKHPDLPQPYDSGLVLWA